jgi:nucleotide-binding universal stress UspA family protein
MISRIVVGVDGSTCAHDALRWAVDLASALDAELVVVHAVGLREAASERATAMAPLDLQSRFESQWCAALDGSGVRSQRLLADGDPVSVLLRSVDDHAADLVVVGSRGIGDRPELLLGSTSSHVAQRSATPVVIVPPRAVPPDSDEAHQITG